MAIDNGTMIPPRQNGEGVPAKRAGERSLFPLEALNHAFMRLFLMVANPNKYQLTIEIL